MEIKVNNYVRCKDGVIAKIINIIEENYGDRGNVLYELDKEIFDDTEGFEENSVYALPDQFVKHSNNIIDLIEDKDFVKIEFYSERYEKRVTRIFEVSRIEEKYITFENMHCDLFMIDGKWSNGDKLLNPIIKSIVTKEQFSSLEYII